MATSYTSRLGLAKPLVNGPETENTWGYDINANSDKIDSLLAPLASPAFTGVPTAPNPPSGISSTQVATARFVAEILSAANGGEIIEAPDDTKIYGRQALGWTELRASTLDYIQAGTGAQAMKTEARIQQNVHVREFGAVPGVGDQTSALRNAASYAQNNGFSLELGAGTYGISSASGFGIDVTKSVRIFGQGRYATLLDPSGVLAGQSVIRLNAAAAGMWGVTLEHFGILARPADVHGITLFPSSNWIAYCNFQHLRIDSGNGYSFFLSPPAGSTGGMFTSTIRECIFGGNGLRLEKLGDSNIIDHVVVHHGDAQHHGTGVYIDSVGGAGSNTITNCNFTCQNGAIVVKTARNLLIEGCNIEYVPGYGSTVPPIQILGDTGRCNAVRIVGNHIGNISATPNAPAALIYVETADNTVISGGTLHDLTDTGVAHAIVIGAAAQDTSIGQVSFSPGDFLGGVGRINDGGAGTRGTIRALNLTDPLFTGGNPGYIKDDSGVVHLMSGIITASSSPTNKVVVTVPPEYTPAFNTYLAGFGVAADGLTYGAQPFVVNTFGEVVYLGPATSDQLTLNGLSWPTSMQTISPFLARDAHMLREPRASEPPPAVILPEVVQPPDLPASVPPWVPPDVPLPGEAIHGH